MAHMALTNNLHDLQDTKDRSWGAIHGWIGCQIYLYYYIIIYIYIGTIKGKVKGTLIWETYDPFKTNLLAGLVDISYAHYRKR